MALKTVELSPKIERFCQEYVIDLNGTQACIRAGYSIKGAHVQASNLLSNPKVKNRISELQDVLSDKNEGLAQAVIDELKKCGFSNVVDYLDAGNEMRDMTTIELDKTAAVASVKKTHTTFDGGEKTTVEFKLHDKISALEKLGRHLGIFEADNSQKKPVIQIAIMND